MKILVLVSRILLGLLFTAIGLNHLVKFTHMAVPPGDGADLLGLMVAHHWFVLYGLIEVTGGLMLLSGLFVPLGLTLLAGMGVNILLFHITLEPSGLAAMLFFAVLELLLVYAYRASFAGIFAARAKPAV
jgi:putative oxidoreductase